MPFLRDSSIGTQAYDLQDFAPTFTESLQATSDETILGGPTAVGFDYYKLQQENQGEKLSAEDAKAKIDASGVQGVKAGNGEYSANALDILIERKRQETIRQDVLSNTQYSWSGTPARALATVAGSIIDPLNVVSAFIPVVGEARIVSLLGNTAVGSIGRAGARAGIGAVEGVVGAAAIEPLVYFGRTQLQDDYSLADSALNLAVGGVLGAGLRAGGGQVADITRQVDPFERFSGLNPQQVQKVFDYEKARLAGEDYPITGFTEGMRKAAGIADEVQAPTAESRVQELYSGTDDSLPKIQQDEWQALLDGYGRDVQATVLEKRAPFNSLDDLTTERANEVAARQLADEFRAQALADTSGRAAKGDIARLRAESEELAKQVQRNIDEANSVGEVEPVSPDRLKELARQYQSEGMKFKDAQKKANKEIARLNEQARLSGDDLQAQREAILERNVDIAARQEAIESQITANAQATQAEQNLAALARGETPESFRQQVENKAAELLAQQQIRAAAREQTAISKVMRATPEQREAAFKSGLAQMLNGRNPDVDVLFKSNPTLKEVQAVADRTQSPDSLAVGDPAMSEAADLKLAEAPNNEDIQAAREELSKAIDRIQQVTAQKGIEPEANTRLQSILSELNQYDAEIQNAESYAKAVKAAAFCGLTK